MEPLFWLTNVPRPESSLPEGRRGLITSQIRISPLKYQQAALYELYLVKLQLSWDSGLWPSVWSRKVPTQV